MNVEPKLAVPAAPVSLIALYRVFFWIGVFSFGGGLTPWMHREIVELRGWMSREQFLSGYAVAQILPGVNSTNLAIFIGQRLRGPLGAATTLAGMLTAPFAFVTNQIRPSKSGSAELIGSSGRRAPVRS